MIKTVPHDTVSPQMINKKYKRLVYTSPDLLARFCKVNYKLVERKKFGLMCFPRICFPGLIYCDQEPLWLLNVIEDDYYFLGVHIRLSTRCTIKFTLRWTVCKLFFSKITQLFPQKSHECSLKLTDLWNTSLLFDLNYKFELIGASLLALAKSILHFVLTCFN